MSTEATVQVLLEKVAEFIEAKLASSTVAAVNSSSTENQNVNENENLNPLTRV